MFHAKTFRKIDELLRQVVFLTKSGMSLDEATSKLESICNVHSKQHLGSIKALLNSDDESLLPSKFGPAKLLNKGMNIVKQKKGNVSIFFQGFYDIFMSGQKNINLTISDSSGLMTYLTAVILVAAVCFSIYTIFVLPMLEELFFGFGVELPKLTQIVLMMSRDYAYLFFTLLLILLGTIFVISYQIKYRMKNLAFFNKANFALPLFGGSAKQYNLYITLNLLYLFIQNGMTEVESLNSINALSDKNSGLDVENILTDKQSIDDLSNTISTALKLGNFRQEIKYQTEIFNEANYNGMNKVKDAISTVGIIVVGLIIGTIVIAMYLPIFQMGKIFN